MNWSCASRFIGLALLGLGLAACGGSEPTPEAPTADTPAKPAAKSAATAAAEAQSFDTGFKVDFIEDKVTPNPKKLPMVVVNGPGYDQQLGKFYADKYRVVYKVANWDAMPEGSYVQFILDNVPFRPVTDPTEKITLPDLNGGKPLEEGEHVLVVYVARKNHEAIKAERAVAVRRFWIGKKTPSDWKMQDPFLALGSPHGSYEGNAARFVMVDYYLLNVELAARGKSMRFTVKGPGFDKDGVKRYVTEWVPLVVMHPRAGKYTITAELLDKNAALIPTPWNPTVRTFTVRNPPQE